MKYLYSESELNSLKKKSNIFYLFFALDFSVEIAIILICLFLSNYHTKLVFSIVGSIFSIIVVFVFIYLLWMELEAKKPITLMEKGSVGARQPAIPGSV